MMRFLLLFLSLPVLETLILYLVHLQIGFWRTVGLVVVTAVVGWFFTRSQGIRTINRIRQDMASGRLPAESLLDGGLILVAGILLMVPGLVTDAVGFGLLIPFSRAWVRRAIAERFLSNFKFQNISTMDDVYDEPDVDGVVEGKVVDKPAD